MMRILDEKPLNRLHHIDSYRQHFMDVRYWQAYIEAVCQREGFSQAVIRIGVPGSYPTFIVDDQWVIKFFGKLFDGQLAFETEYEANCLLRENQVLSAPQLLHQGQLFNDSTTWCWPYLIYEFWPGLSIGQVYEQVSQADKIAVAQMMGQMTKKIHQISVTMGRVLQPSWQPYLNFLQTQQARCRQFHQEEGLLPLHWLDQIEAYLWVPEALIDPQQQPHLIHADLTADHIFGQLTETGWQMRGLIDFGDAMVADWGYELIALHLALFRCDKSLLAAYLEAYNLGHAARQQLPHKVMTLTLLHRFNVLEGAFKVYPEIADLATLADLASLLWDVDT